MEHVVAELDVPERRACRVLGQHRSTQRKPPTRPEDEAALTADIVALSTRLSFTTQPAVERSSWAILR